MTCSEGSETPRPDTAPRVIPYYSLHCYAPVILHNLLPYDVEFSLQVCPDFSSAPSVSTLNIRQFALGSLFTFHQSFLHYKMLHFGKMLSCFHLYSSACVQYSKWLTWLLLHAEKQFTIFFCIIDFKKNDVIFSYLQFWDDCHKIQRTLPTIVLGSFCATPWMVRLSALGLVITTILICCRRLEWTL